MQMDSIFDNITSLIKKDLGDPYRLAHIKSRLERNKKLTLSDTNYLNRLLTLSNLRNIENNENPALPALSQNLTIFLIYVNLHYNFSSPKKQGLLKNTSPAIIPIN